MRFRLTFLAALVTTTIVTAAQPPTQGPPAQVFGSPKSERCRQFLASHL